MNLEDEMNMVKRMQNPDRETDRLIAEANQSISSASKHTSGILKQATEFLHDRIDPIPLLQKTRNRTLDSRNVIPPRLRNKVDITSEIAITKYNLEEVDRGWVIYSEWFRSVSKNRRDLAATLFLSRSGHLYQQQCTFEVRRDLQTITSSGIARIHEGGLRLNRRERRDYAELVQIQRYAIESHSSQMEKLRISVGDTYLTIEDQRKRRCLDSEDELVYCIPFTGVQGRYGEVSPELRDDGTLSPTDVLYGSPRFACVRNSDSWISFSGYKEGIALGGDPNGNAIICGDAVDSWDGTSIAFRFKTWLAKVLINPQLRD